MKSIASLFVYGTGIKVPIRKTTSINNVKTIFFLMSATRIKLEIVRNIKSPRLFRRRLQLLPLLSVRIDGLLLLTSFQVTHFLTLLYLTFLCEQHLFLKEALV